MGILDGASISGPLFIYITLQNKEAAQAYLERFSVRRGNEILYSSDGRIFPLPPLEPNERRIEMIYLGSPHKPLKKGEDYNIEVWYRMRSEERVEHVRLPYSERSRSEKKEEKPPAWVEIPIKWLRFIFSLDIIALLLLPIWFLFELLKGSPVGERTPRERVKGKS